MAKSHRELQRITFEIGKDYEHNKHILEFEGLDKEGNRYTYLFDLLNALKMAATIIKAIIKYTKTTKDFVMEDELRNFISTLPKFKED